ncbi:MAG TPA: CPBP family intramembrane glutamic endopeptidase [Sediminibacterium sp.]|nr:CPBP family intramembrane glutamic endopeptidase [Sediminibacterium sp.]
MKLIKIITGFFGLFCCYHLADYRMLRYQDTHSFLLLLLGFLVLAWAIARWLRLEKGLAAWGLPFNRKTFSQLGRGFMAGTLVYGSFFIACLLLNIESLVLVPAVSVLLPQVLLFGFGTFLASVAEDILTRSYLYRFLKDTIPSAGLVVLSAFVYVLNHIFRLHEGITIWTYLFIIGLFLMIALVRSGNLWITVGLHWSGNMVYQLSHNILVTKPGSNHFPELTLYIFFLILLIPVSLVISKNQRAKTAVIQMLIPHDS